MVVVLYGRVLSLPLYWDDARHYEYSHNPSLAEIWTNRTGYGYYRPAIFTLYKFAFIYLTPQFTFLCYGAGLAIHALNSLLAGKVTMAFLEQGRSTRPATVSPVLAGFLASMLFAAYPFSLYVVASFAAAMHLWVTGFALAGMLATLKFAQAPRKRWLLVMTLCAALAPWFHEAGVAVAAGLVIELALLNWRLAWRYKASLGLMVVLAGVFVAAWLMVHKTRGETQLMDVKSMLDSLAVFVQALTFPVQPLATQLVKRLGWPEITSVWVVAVPSLLAVALLLLKRAQWRPLVFGLIWFGLACLPVIAFLPYWYIVPSPRLLYEAGLAAILLWSLAFVALAAYASRRWQAPAVAGLAVLALALPVSFIEEKVNLFQVALAPLTQLASLARTYPSETHLVVNPAEWVADVADPYPLGRWGVSIAPGYVTLNELVSINAGLQTKFDGVYFPPVRTEMEGHNWAVYREDQPLDWPDLAALAPRYNRVWLTTYARSQIAVEEAGAVVDGESGRPTTYLASFEDKVYLISAKYQMAGQAVAVTLQWKYLGPNPDATVFRHVLDCAGNMVGSGDGYAVGRMVPFGLLRPGAVVRDERRIPLETTAGDGCYALEIGLFRADGSRVTAVAPGGTEFENDAVLVR